MRRIDVPETVWRPIAEAIAAAGNITLPAMLYGPPRAVCLFIPRARFWKSLRGLGYSYPAIAAVTGHHHTTIMLSARSKTLDQAYTVPTAVSDKPWKARPRKDKTKSSGIRGALFDMTGARTHFLTVLGPAPARPTGKRGRRWWRCRCDCGRETVLCTEHLGPDGIKSCGYRAPGIHVGNKPRRNDEGLNDISAMGVADRDRGQAL